jgi:glycosyltransferase involved in cell wall biosynthesis
MIKASVILPHFNQKEHLIQTLKALKDQTLSWSEYEIIVCDDGGYLEKDFDPSIKIITFPRSGSAFARNIGIKNASGDVLIFLDADMVVQRDFIKRHIDFHHLSQKAICCGIRHHQKEDGTFQDSDVRERLLKHLNKTLETLNHPWFLCYTCNVSIKKAHVIDNLFDEHFINWGLEDIEWAFRLYQKKFTFHLDKASLCHHLYHNREMTKERFLNWKNNLEYMILKHPKLKVLKNFIPVFDPDEKKDFFLTYEQFENAEFI